jgi:methionyl-tRNA synthetase
MVLKYFDGVVPNVDKVEDIDNDLISIANDMFATVKDYMDKLDAPSALVEIWKLVQRANKYIDETMPWTLAKEGDTSRLATVMYNLIESIRMVAVLLRAYMVETPDKIFESIGVPEQLRGFDSMTFGTMPAGYSVVKCPPLFPRIDIDKDLMEIEG